MKIKLIYNGIFSMHGQKPASFNETQNYVTLQNEFFLCECVFIQHAKYINIQ